MGENAYEIGGGWMRTPTWKSTASTWSFAFWHTTHTHTLKLLRDKTRAKYNMCVFRFTEVPTMTLDSVYNIT
jgi:hypothetical protein